MQHYLISWSCYDPTITFFFPSVWYTNYLSSKSWGLFRTPHLYLKSHCSMKSVNIECLHESTSFLCTHACFPPPFIHSFPIPLFLNFIKLFSKFGGIFHAANADLSKFWWRRKFSLQNYSRVIYMLWCWKRSVLFFHFATPVIFISFLFINLPESLIMVVYDKLKVGDENF